MLLLAAPAGRAATPAGVWDLLLDAATGRATSRRPVALATETAGDDGATGFWVATGVPVTFRRSIPAGARLTMVLASRGPASLAVRAGTRRESLAAGTSFVRHELELPAIDEITFEATRGAVFVGGARVAPCPPPEARPALAELRLLISCDTLRADALGCYGAPGAASPHVDRLSRRAALHEDALSNSPWTLPSHMTLLTGLYPGEHRVTPRKPLDPAFETLAERLASRGFATGGFATKVGWLDAAFGFSRGFDVYVLAWEDARPAIDRMLAWLDGLGAARAFAFLHLYDAHSDASRRIYDAAPPFRGGSVPGEPALQRRRPTTPGSAALLAENDALAAGAAPAPPSESREVAACYGEGALAMDHDVGRLLRHLRARCLDGARIVLTSDHGEEFMEHGRYLHGTLHGEVARVPLLVAGDGEPGLRDAPVELADLAPYLEGDAPLRPSEVRFGFGPGALRSIVKGRHKLLADLGTGPTALYDVEADPGERHDLLGAEPRIAASLHRELLAQLARNDQRYKSVAGKGDAAATPDVPGEASRPVLPEDDLERLKGLGYTGP